MIRGWGAVDATASDTRCRLTGRPKCCIRIGRVRRTVRQCSAFLEYEGFGKADQCACFTPHHIRISSISFALVRITVCTVAVAHRYFLNIIYNLIHPLFTFITFPPLFSSSFFFFNIFL